MRHRGTLFAPDNADGIIAVFVLDEDRFSLEVAGDEWAGWHVSLITLSEIGVNEYEFSLNGDRVRFVPDSRLDFAYGAVPRLAKAQEDATKGFRARRKTKKVTQDSTDSGGRITPIASPAAKPPAPAAAERPIKVKAPKVAKVKTKKSKAEKPVANKPVVAVVAAPATAPQAADVQPADVVPGTRKVSPAATAPAASTRTPSVPAPSVTQPEEDAAQPAPVASADPFSKPITAAVTTPPTAPTKGELVIDLRATDDAKKAASAPTLVATATNGHHQAHATKTDAKGGLRILERVRQSRAEHVHDYEVSSSGVMVRRVCSTCNHVSIGTSD
jgi:hypothetical protein